eukprot:s2186_g9.t1
MESDDTLHPHHFGKGDALVFLSHKAHCVQPVTHGLRQTLVMELWEGEERCCNHRCQQRWGPCASSTSSAAPNLQRLREEGPNLFAATAFDGVAFFPSLGRILRQSAKRRKAEANVEVLFEEVRPKAFVRATRKIRKGEMLVLKSLYRQSNLKEFASQLHSTGGACVRDAGKAEADEWRPQQVVAILRTRPAGDDMISFTDFVAATLSGAQCKDGHCRSAFRIFDRNADGYIDAKELELILRKGESSACLTEPAQATVAMLKEAGAGMVSFKDFVNFVKRGASLEL